MKKCICKGWEENSGVIDSAILSFTMRGYGKLKKSFSYCPYCGKELEEVKKNEKDI